MSEPTGYLLALRAATAELLNSLAGLQWSDADVAAPSLCDGWTRGHLLTHVARNADGICDTLAGALRGEIVERYPGGKAARDAAIEEGSRRPFAALVVDVRDSAERLDRVFGAIGDANGWELPTAEGNTAAAWVFWRWREIEIHHVDLDAGYTPDRWPPLFVNTLLPQAAGTLAERAEAPLRVTVTAEGSITSELVGKTWAVRDGEATDVRGPDWAVLAWLVGRPQAVAEHLSALPPLAPWR